MTSAPGVEPVRGAGGGEMSERVRAFDWSKTAIGPIEGWSPALRMQVDFLLANRFPLLLWWGPTFCSIYNDAYAPILGAKHPWALGRPVSECWSEIWDVLEPLIETPFQGGPATWIEDFELEIRRHGYLEEGHFTVAYSPVPDETAPRGIGGVIATVHEISAKILAERRVAALRDLGSRAAEAKTAEQACAIAAATLDAYPKDVPFALLYLIDAGGEAASLAGAAGVAVAEDVSPLRVALDETPATGWPLAEARRAEAIVPVERIAERFSTVPPGPWSDPPHTAVVMPIPSHKAHEPAGLLVAGVSPRLRLDEHYLDFLELLRTQVATAIANARAYEEEKRRAEALAEIDRAKTAFFSNVSHEFRTPLTLMLGPIEDLLAKSRTLAPGAAAELEIAHRNGLRLLRLVNTLLDFARIEAGKIRATYQPTDLAAFTAELASVFRAAVERAGLRLTVDCPALEQPVFVDRDMWEKIVLNLLSNAFKFTFEGEIAVTLASAGADAELRVRDTGTGIPAHEVPRLFERFHRIENARSRTHEGSGIGLALVHELVKQHGGSIAAESVVGAGTTFVVRIPFGSSHLPSDRIGESRGSASAGTMPIHFVEEALHWLPDAERGGARHAGEPLADVAASPVPALRSVPQRDEESPVVLVADDNADIRHYVARLLGERYTVRSAADGTSALASARERRPDLVLTDVMMPRLDGFGLLRALRADPDTCDVPVILLSARAGEESRVEGMEAGADDYLIKPFSARELLARVAAHLQIARMRRDAAEAARRRGAQFQALLHHAPVGVYLVDAELRLREVNPIALPLFGALPGDVVGRDLGEVARRLWGQRHGDAITAMFRHTLETGEPHFASEQAGLRADRGVTEWYEWRIDRIPLADGGFGVVAYFRDISAQVTARKAIEESREALRDADRRKDEFLAMLAHELRGPLAPLRNLLAILRRSGDAGAAQHAHDTMERQVDHLVRLVDDLLDVSRITRNRLELRREPVELASLLHQVIESCRPLIEQFGHEVSFAPPPEPVPLWADPVRLHQVFANLVNNACKYTPPKGAIRLAAERQGDLVAVTIGDTGVGIPREELRHIFETFAQVDSTLDLAQGGLGLGLTLAKRLVELHGGTVTAHSEGRGRGSEFVVRLPVLAETPRPEPRKTAGEPSGAPRRRRFLVVDDNADGADSLALLLEMNGHEAHVARDGSEALEAVERLRPDVVLLDLGLPKLSGYEVCRRIREQPWGQAMRIVAVTGWGQEQHRSESREAGFDGHLVKPVELGDVLKISG